MVREVIQYGNIARGRGFHKAVVELAFGPLAHGTQHSSSLSTFGGGGRIGVYSGVCPVYIKAIIE